MSRPTNWQADRYRRIIQKNGYEHKKVGLSSRLFLPPPRRRPAKADMRAEAERLVADFHARRGGTGHSEEAGK
jgi:hypothetical protein